MKYLNKYEKGHPIKQDVLFSCLFLKVRIKNNFLFYMKKEGIIKVVEGLPNLLRVFREGLA